MLVWLNTKYFFITVRTQLPALVYLLLITCIIPLQRFNPVLISSAILIFIINRLFASYKYEGLALHYFDAAFMAAISSLFYVYSIYFIAFIWIGLLIFRTFRWREWLFSVIGMAVPYLFIFAYYFYIGKNIKQEFITLFSSFTGKEMQVNYTIEFRIYILYVLFLILISSAFMIRSFDIKKIQGRKFFLFFFWAFIVSLLFYFIVPSVGIEIFYIVSIPLSYLIGHYFIFASENWINNVLFILMLAGVFLLVYFHPLLSII